MSTELHILVTCTKRKTRDPEKSLLMRGIKGKAVDARLADWVARVESSSGPTVEAGGLYAGDHWQVSSALPALAAARGYRPRLWVVSAGYGLIESTAPVHAYAAAFSPGHPDCVVAAKHPGGTVAGFKEWWTGMGKWRGPTVGAPRTIAELVVAHPRATFLVVASELYLRAVWDDLVGGAGRLHVARGGNLVVVSAGTKDFGPLADYAIPLDARMQGALGGARRSLNVRMARRLLGWMAPGMPLVELRERCERAMGRVEIRREPPRPRCSDGEVVTFIRREVSRVARPSASALLRRFRDEGGRACEQRRFARLFRGALEVTHA